MSEEEKRAIEHFKNYPVNWEFTYEVNQMAIDIVLHFIQKQQAEIDKKDNEIKTLIQFHKEISEIKDKIIYEMAEQLVGLTIWNTEKDEPLILTDIEDVIEYFTKKVEDNK